MPLKITESAKWGGASLAMRSFASRHRGESGGFQVRDELSDFARHETE